MIEHYDRGGDGERNQDPRIRPLNLDDQQKQDLKAFLSAVENNRRLIPNYGERFRQGETISTAFVDSTVNQVVSKRMVKRQ